MGSFTVEKLSLRMADLHEIRPEEIQLGGMNDLKPVTVPSTFESLASGAIGGISLVLVGHPLDLLKVRLQTAPKITLTPLSASSYAHASGDQSMKRIFSNLLKKEGISGIYRGVTAPLIGVAPIFAISIWGYDTGKGLASKYLKLNSNDPFAIALGGAFSALPTSLLQVPGDRIKLRLQVSNSLQHANPLQETRKIWNEGSSRIIEVYNKSSLKRNVNNNFIGGVRSLYRGYWITLAREIPGSAIYFSNYYYMRNFITSNLQNKSTLTPDSVMAISILISGGVAGTLNGLITLPIDTIKSRFQAAPIGEFRSARHVAVELLRTEGLAAFFRGLGPVLLRAFPANAACFSGIEIVRYLCK